MTAANYRNLRPELHVGSMSTLTLSLLDQKPPRNAKRWWKRMETITDRLVERYGTPSLGNYRDPIKEIFYIALSAKTSEVHYQAAYKRLWAQFPTLSDIAAATESEIFESIGKAGLGAKRSAQVKEIARRLTTDFSRHPGSALRKYSAELVFEYLCGLPGIGPKSALCVMMYSLDFDVFPVDTHVRRTLGRIGVSRPDMKHYRAQEKLPALVPPGRSKELHVTLITLGRTVCLPRSPNCEKCAIAALCKTGLKRTSLLNTTK